MVNSMQYLAMIKLKHAGSMHARHGKDGVCSLAGTKHNVASLLLQYGHFTYECKNEAAYQARPSRTQQLKNPKVR